MASCQGQEDATSIKCQQLELGALSCLMPFWGAGCAIFDAVNRCGDRIEAFQQCAGTSGWPFLPVVNTAKCSPTLTERSSPDCLLEFSCPTGSYDISCTSKTDGAVPICSCSGQAGELNDGGSLYFSLTTSNRCQRAADACLY